MSELRTRVTTTAAAGPALTRPDTLPQEIAGLLSVLLRLIDQRGQIVLYLTSSVHGEGTSMIAAEVAAAAARWDWCDVVLVDANRPPITSSARGLLDGNGDTFELALRTRRTGGNSITEATLIGAAGSVPRVDTVRSLFERLRKRFTLVIVDSPPVLASEQTAAFCAAADCVVLVVEAERTRVEDLERARTTLEQLGGHVLGTVLNKRRYRFTGKSGYRS